MKDLLGWAEDEGRREGGSRFGRSKQSECFLAYGRLAALLVWTVTPDVGKEPSARKVHPSPLMSAIYRLLAAFSPELPATYSSRLVLIEPGVDRAWC